jgi:hypothetical protein
MKSPYIGIAKGRFLPGGTLVVRNELSGGSEKAAYSAYPLDRRLGAVDLDPGSTRWLRAVVMLTA